MGLMGGVSLVTMKLIEDQTNNQNMLKSSSEISKTMGVLTGALNNEAACKNMLGGKSFGTLTNLMTTTTRSTDGAVMNQYYLEAGKSYSDFSIPANGLQLNKIVTSDNSKNNAELVITFNFNKKKGITSTLLSSEERSIKKSIPLNVKYNAAGTGILSCAPAVSDVSQDAKVKFCNSLGGVAQIDSNGNCRLKSMDCPYGKIPRGLTSLGGVNCVNIQANDIFQENSTCSMATGKVQIIFDSASGKYKLQCY